MSSRRRDEGLDLVADEPLCAFVDQVRSTYAFGPPPEIGTRLSAVLTRGLGTVEAAERRMAAPARPTWRLAGRVQGRRARLGLGAAVASLTFLGTGAAGALPGPAQSAFEHTAEVVGIELPVPTRRETPPAPPENEPGAEPAVPTGGGGGSDGAGPGVEEPEPGPSPAPTGGGPGPGGGPPAAPEAGRPGDAGDRLEREPGHGRPDGVPAPTVPQPLESPGVGPPSGFPAPVGGADDEAGRAPGRTDVPAPGPQAAAGTPSGPAAGGPPAAAAPAGTTPR
jgi:hypothetical protein